MQAEQRRFKKSLLARSARQARQAPLARPATDGRYLRSFSYEVGFKRGFKGALGREEHLECFKAPFLEAPEHWPEGFKASTLPRVAWLPPGWGQALKALESKAPKALLAPGWLRAEVVHRAKGAGGEGRGEQADAWSWTPFI